MSITVKSNMITKGTHDFMSYAGAVIKSRAIPCAEDNLKPVQRRILYTMAEDKLWNKGKTVKCAKVTGEVMGKYHPHGDASIYDAMVHMSQWWKIRYPLIEIQGNNGSLNGDGPAAQRYTECKLTLAGEYLLKNVDPDIVPYAPNYDDSTTEPELLPSMFPNVLCNGTLGIAVGMSCSLLPHNLNEVVKLLIGVAKDEVKTVKEALAIMPGPDFPLGGIVTDGYKLEQAYATGQGTITLRAKHEIDNKTNTITFSEFPYLVDVETRIIKAIKDMVGDGYMDIENVENHIGKNSCYIRVILGKKANAQKVLQDLFDKTPLQKTIKINNTVILNGVPMTMNLLGLCRNYIKYQHNILVKMATKEKAKQDHIVHINKGLILAVAKIDEVIAIVRNSDTKDEARNKLIDLLGVDSEQADAILALQLGRLTRLDANDINVKIQNAQKESDYQATIINNVNVRTDIIISNLNDMSKKFGDERRTTILVGSNEPKETETVNENIITILNDGSLVEIEKNKFDTIFKKGNQLAKYSPIMWIYSGGKPVTILHKDGTTSTTYDPLDSQSLFVWDKTKDFIVTVSHKGIVKKTAMSEYKKVDKLCKVKTEDKIIYAFCCNSDDYILCLLENDKAQSIKVEDIKLSGKLTIGNKGTSEAVRMACCVEKDKMFYTLDTDSRCKKCLIEEVGATAVKLNDSCVNIGAVKENMYYYDGSKIIPINWNEVAVKGRTAQGAKLSSKQLGIIG